MEMILFLFCTFQLARFSLPTPDFSCGYATAGSPTFFEDKSSNANIWNWDFGDSLQSTKQNPSHVFQKSGNYSVTLKATNSEGTNSITKLIIVANPEKDFNIVQTISDGAQLTTLAFSALSMLTGDFNSQSFFPPGKVADYTGFQYLRDNDEDGMGHTTDFLTKVSYNVLYILNSSQLAKMQALATSQETLVSLYGYKRFALMKAFRRLVDHDIPVWSNGLSLSAVKAASKELYLIDGQISYDRALLYSEVLKSFNDSQNLYLNAMKGVGYRTWPNITKDMINDKMKGLAQGSSVAMMTYAGDLFSWIAGNVESDTYFCPERQGTYYGGFYMKDAPAIGVAGYSIDTELTATAGSALCDESKGYVTSKQASLIQSLVEIQRKSMYAGDSEENIVSIRYEISSLLRNFLSENYSSDSIKEKVNNLSGNYGDLDGENNYYYATVFAELYDSFNSSQKSKIQALRKTILCGNYSNGQNYDFTTCLAPYLYSTVITDTSVLSSYISNTDYLFQINSYFVVVAVLGPICAAFFFIVLICVILLLCLFVFFPRKKITKRAQP